MQKYLDKFAEYLKIKNYSKGTIKEYIFDLGHFNKYLTAHGIVEITGITKEILYKYQSWLYSEYKSTASGPFRRGGQLSIGTQGKILSIIKSYFKFLHKEGYIIYDPAGSIELPKQTKTIPRDILTKKEMKKLLEAPDLTDPFQYRDRVALEILYATGMRKSELFNLKIKDIDTENREITIYKGKGNKDRMVPIGRKALKYIEEYIKRIRAMISEEQSVYLLTTERGGKLSVNCMQARIKELARKCKIQKRITFHTFRHTCATHLLQGKASIRHIQAILGHESLQTTQKYTRVELSDLKKVFEKTHPREKFSC